VLLCLVLLGGAAWVLGARRGPAAASLLPAVVLGASAPTAPPGVRIRVQVLNTTRTRGLARRATRLLRDRGYDVVEFGTTTPQRDTTLVLDRSGHPDWAQQVAAVMGGAEGRARAEARPDSSRYLDVTVLVGRLWRPPAEPLYP
jgi:hypothetical protein